MEPVSRSRAAFWILVAAFVAVAAVPSVVLMESVQRYVDFLSGWNPVVLRARSTSRLPHRGPRAADSTLPAMRFVEFKLKAPKAKHVLLAGDFNQWRPETLPLTRGRGGVWQTLLPLPPGRYSYLFQVDGEWTPDPDPKIPRTGRFDDRPASLKEVE